MSETHDSLASLATAYVLGALEPIERQTFEEHLAVCASCTAEVDSLRPIAAGLAQAVPQISPRDTLRDRVLTTVGAVVVPRATRVATPPPPRSTSGASLLPYAAVLALAAGLGVYAWEQRARMRDLETRLQQADTQTLQSRRELSDAQRATADAQRTIAVLTAPDLARIDLAGQAPAPQATARALWSRQRGMVFTATNLPPLAGGRVYQVWVVTEGAPPVSAGLLTPDPSGRASAYFATPIDIGNPIAVAVTLEPAGGRPGPTGDQFLVGKPVAG